ncbi:MAG: type II and III secretion system protein [Planctomycetota bacterium]
MAGYPGGVVRAACLIVGGFGVTACSVAPPVPAPSTQVQVSVDDGAPTAADALAERVWGPGLPAEASTGPAAAAVVQDPVPGASVEASLRARFGSTILIAPDGSVTKQYYLSGETAGVFLNLLHDPGQGPRDEAGKPPASFGPLRVGAGENALSVLGQVLGEQQVEVFFLARFEVPESVKLRPGTPKRPPLELSGAVIQPTEGAPTHLLLVSAQPDALATFEGALDLFFASIPQIEIEVKVIEYSTSDTLAFGIEPVQSSMMTTIPTLTNGGNNQLVQEIVTQFPLSAPLVGTANLADRGIVMLGGIHDAWQLSAQLQALEARGVADIISSPRLVVRNGGVASITTKTDFPYPEASISSSGQNITANIRFRPVGIALNIRPVIAGTDTVILQVLANLSVVTSFANTDPVQTPVVSNREVHTSVHVPAGKTTVIGGLVSSDTFEQTSQVPLLGDVPILGLLFRSTSTTENRTTLEFHITPRIVRGQRGYVSG